MRPAFAVVWMVLGVVSFLQAQEPTGDEGDRALLQGTWSVQSIEIGGRPIRNLRDMKYKFEGDVLVRDGNECQVVLDPAPTPKHVDLVYPDGTRELGTYTVEGKELSLWFNDQFNVRPGEFAPNARQIRLVRIKKAGE